VHSECLHVTKACNLRCKYCYFSASQPLPAEMTRAELARVWPDVVALAPEKVVFTGGEPLTRPDIVDLLADLQTEDVDHTVLRCLNTNGHLVTPAFAERLVGLVDEVRVSLDGMQAANDAQRGAGNFVAAVKALEAFYAVGFEPKVLVTVTSASLPHLAELLSFLYRNRFTRVNVNLFRAIGRGTNHPEWTVGSAEVAAIVRHVWNSEFPGQQLQSDPDVEAEQRHCGVGHFLNVLPNGDVFPCHVLTHPEFRCGNLRSERLLDICRRSALLTALSSSDFREIAGRHHSLAAIAHAGTCLGDIYNSTRGKPSWKRFLPLRDVELDPRVTTDPPSGPA
jgi:MoaA/NifB/PqqE/SkfB family radical SAM enzyme